MLPLGLRVVFGRFLGTLLSYFPGREFTVAELQIGRFLPELDSKLLARKVYSNLGATLFESLNLAPLVKASSQHIQFEREDLLAEILKTNQPVVAFSAHVGNWDLLAAYMVSRGVNLATIGRQVRNDTLQHVLSSIRASYGVRTIWRTGSGTLGSIQSELAPGSSLAALIDQDTKVRSMRIPFFGEPARTPSALALLGKRVNARFFAAFCVRTDRGKYKIILEELDNSIGIGDILISFNTLLEDTIRQYPSQWAWIHKRWCSFEDGTRMDHETYLNFLRKPTGTYD